MYIIVIADYYYCFKINNIINKAGVRQCESSSVPATPGSMWHFKQGKKGHINGWFLPSKVSLVDFYSSHLHSLHTRSILISCRNTIKTERPIGISYILEYIHIQVNQINITNIRMLILSFTI